MDPVKLFDRTTNLLRANLDRRGTAQEARAEALRRLGVKNRVHYFGPERRDKPGLAELVRILGGTEPAGPAVAVVRAVGPISVEGDELPLGGGEGIAERRLGRLLRKLRDDPEVKAVVLRIDSPGGSALASDLLWTELTALRERKPLVASVGGMAASGGYYLAAAARSIVAEPTSIVGSIGVVGGKLSFARSLEHIGVHVETVAPEGAPAEGRRALYSSALAPWDEATRAKVEAMARSAYDLFVERVAKGRGLPVERVRGSAEGRIFAAADAKKLGLVDELGGLDVALELALKLADLPPTATIEVVDLPPGLLELIGMPSPQDRDEEARRLEQRAQRAARRELLGPLGRAREPAEALLGSLAPLLGAERVVAALPFGVVLR
ncbi:MAG: signal peptide peptidase SppA [Deltaproteobacteria bacterium]|nr:signal peptide peptidase SppA [Deltaproteobacteria bacterium]